jgi:regulator of replication initiation timing
MPRKRKVNTELQQEENTVPPVIEVNQIAEPASLLQLFERLKEFDNKVLLERVSTLERSIGLIYKEQVNLRGVLKEIQQIVSFLSVAQEELLNSLGVSIEASEEGFTATEEPPEQKSSTAQATKDGKKWN